VAFTQEGNFDMGTFYDLGRAVVGGWMGGAWLSHDPVQNRDLIWGGEFGQEGANLFAIDAASGEVVEEQRIGAREFSVTVDPASGTLWIHNYHGLNQPGNILQSWDPTTRQLSFHGFPLLSGHRFVAAFFGPDGRLYLGTHPFGHLVSFDPSTATWSDHGCQAPQPIVPGQHIWCRPFAVNDAGEIICQINRVPPHEVVAFDPASGEMRKLDQAPAAPAALPAGVRQDGRPESKQGNAITADLEARSYTLNGKTRTFAYTPKVATDIVGLNLGPDGNIYGSTIISMHVFKFDTTTRQLADLGRVGFGHGEVYDVIAHGDKLYMGSYTGAYWAAYDPTKPWHPRQDVGGQAPDANPRCFGQMGHDMNRPFEYAVGPDDRIYIACRADYGLTGGGMVRFDPATEAMDAFRDENQSLQAIAADDRYVYGGTSISGGRGSIEPTQQARFFMFDPQSATRVYETIPFGDVIAIGSLACSPVTGLVYGTTDTGMLFAFSPDERQVVQTWQLRSLGTPLMGVPETYGIIHLTAGSDGNIYGVTNTDLFTLNVDLDRVIYLDQPPISDLYQIVEGRPGVFYIGARGHLLEYHVKGTPHHR
jgi:outer membrane protein assembly factor BamB